MNPTLQRYLITAVLLLGAAVFALIVYDKQVQLDAARALEREGVQTRAQVTDLSLGGRKVTRYHLSYRFTVGDRTFYATRRQIPWAAYSELEVGMSVPVRFHPSNPNIHVTAHEVARLSEWSDRIGFSLVSLLLAAGAISLNLPERKKPQPKRATSGRARRKKDKRPARR